MKRYIRFSTVLFVFIFLSTQLIADNTLQIIEGQTNVNTIAEIPVIMENSDDIIAFQMDIPIPSQLSYVSGSAMLNPDRVVDHIISATLLPNGTLRIMGYSMTNTPFAGNTGELLIFQLQASSFPGTYPLNFTTAVLGDIQSNNIITAAINGSLSVMGPDISVSSTSVDFGSVPLLESNNKYITIYNTGNTDLDIQSITSSSPYFIIISSTNFIIGAGASSSLHLRFNAVVKNTYNETITIHSNDADQGNFEIEVLAIAFAVNELHTGDVFSYSGDYSILDFTMNNMEPIVSFQFDLNLPEPMDFVTDSIFLSSRKGNHNISANMIADNILRVVAFSVNNQWFSGDDGLILQIGFNVEGVGGYYNIGISNVILGDTLGLNAVSDFTDGSLQIAAADISSSSSIDFGDVSILESKTISHVIYNYGTDTLEIESISFTNSSFSTDQALPLNINPGNNSSIDIIFSNANEGSIASVMKLFSNDPDENPFIVNLTANVYIPNYISIHDSMYTYGETMFVDVLVDNEEAFIGFQFDLAYPDSLTCLINQVELGQRGGDHSFIANQINSNTIRLLAYSLTQEEFTGNSGTIISIPFTSDSASYGAIPLVISNAILGNAQSEDILWGINNDSIFVGKQSGIFLQSGWNMISFNHCPHPKTMASIIQPLIDSSNLIKVIDEAGGFIQEIPNTGWLNTIGTMENTEGYYIKVINNDSLITIGVPVSTPYSIPLQTGMNMMAYPAQNSQDALIALEALINSSELIKVINESGGLIQYIPDYGWFNTIGNFEPGEGYYIKVNTNTAIVFDESMTKINQNTSRVQEGEYYSRNSCGNPYLPMHIVANFDNDIVLAEGDELGAFVDDICIGSVLITDPSSLSVAFLSTNDPTTELIDGGNYGDLITFKLLHLGKEYNLYCKNQQSSAIFYSPLTTKALTFSAEGFNTEKNFYISEVIPNPFTENSRIYLNIPNPSHLQIEMIDLRGMVIKKIYNNEVNAGNVEVSIDAKGIPSGVYFIRITYVYNKGSDVVLRKLVINK